MMTPPKVKKNCYKYIYIWKMILVNEKKIIKYLIRENIDSQSIKPWKTDNLWRGFWSLKEEMPSSHATNVLTIELSVVVLLDGFLDIFFIQVHHFRHPLLQQSGPLDWSNSTKQFLVRNICTCVIIGLPQIHIPVLVS